jgi:hypothetical protein
MGSGRIGFATVGDGHTDQTVFRHRRSAIEAIIVLK